MSDAAMAVVQSELDRRDAEIARLRALWAAVAQTSRERKAEADGRRQYAEQLKAERDQLKVAAQAETRAANRWMAEANQAEATIARVKALAEKLIATGDVSIGGIWSDHNIEIGRDILAVLTERSDLPAVRALVAGFDPRQEPM